MTGHEIITWAIEKCRQNGVPPTDANVLMYIREWREPVRGWK